MILLKFLIGDRKFSFCNIFRRKKECFFTKKPKAFCVMVKKNREKSFIILKHIPKTCTTQIFDFLLVFQNILFFKWDTFFDPSQRQVFPHIQDQRYLCAQACKKICEKWMLQGLIKMIFMFFFSWRSVNLLLQHHPSEQRLLFSLKRINLCA